jgi:hypothetical protein
VPVSVAATPGLTDTQLRASAVPVSMAATPGLTDTQLRASAVPVSMAATPGLTDTQLRASAVPVSMAATPGLTDAQLRASAVAVAGSANVGDLPVAPPLSVSGVDQDGKKRHLSLDLQGRLRTKLEDQLPISLGAKDPSASFGVALSSDVTISSAIYLAINTDLLTGTVNGWYDAKDSHSISMQIIGSAGISAGSIIFECTNDPSNAPGGNLWLVEEDTNISTGAPITAAQTVSASAVRMFRSHVTSRYIRIRISTAFVGGTVQVAAVLSQLPYNRMIQTVGQANSNNLNASIVGSTAEDASVSTQQPVLVGGMCRTSTAPVTLVANDAVKLTMAANGGAVVAPYAVPETFWSANLSLTTTTAAAAASAAGASLKRHITSFWAINTGASAVDLILLDGATERQRYPMPPNVPMPVTFPTGVILTANTALNFNLSAAGTVRVNAHGYTGV